MRLLIIGGTRFVGRHLVEAALLHGHELTLFNRGQSAPDLFPQVEQLYGNRDSDLAALKGRQWDAVIDTCGYVPRVVSRSVKSLAAAVDRYVFISTVSVYAEENPPGMDERSSLAKLKDDGIEEVNGETYGGLKVLCEAAVTQVYGVRALIVRPGLIVGPYDPTDRFTYWPWRVARGGDVLAPGNPDQPVQIIDARDLSAWIVRLIEMQATGVFNAVGPDYLLTTRRILDECMNVCNPAAHLTWVDEQFLLQAGAEPWSEIPVWVPEKDAAFNTASNAKAIAAGLKFRPLAETIRDTLAWHATRPIDYEWLAGLKPDREAQLLHEWQQRRL